MSYEQYRLSIRRYLGIADSIEADDIDRLILFCWDNKIEYSVQWIKKRLGIRLNYDI